MKQAFNLGLLDIAGQRLRNQHICHPPLRHPAAVVRWLGAVQAQDYLGALWALGLRLPAATQADMEQAIADRTIVRTWPMRSTLHLVAPEDVRWMLQLLTPRIIAGSARRYRQLELDETVFARCGALLQEALQGGKQLTRPELYQVLAQANLPTAHARGLHILGHLAQKGLICFGPRQGKQPTFTLLDEWVPPAPTKDREEALGELARRYFTSHGPATGHDFAWWSGLKLADARLGIAITGEALAKEVMGGQPYWLAPTGPLVTSEPATVHLLPAFDEYTVAYKNRRDILDPRFEKRLNAGGGILHPVMVAHGQVAGTWKRTLKPKAVAVAFHPFKALEEKVAAAFSAAAHRYGRFLNLPVALSWKAPG
jgi:hypothetical protein